MNEAVYPDAANTGINAAAYTPVSPLQAALCDIKDGLVKFPIWWMLAYQDIKLRYRRSVIGPFWITLSMAITVYTMGFLYSHLFHIPLEEYFPYLVAGMLAWSLIANTIIDMVDTFTINAHSLKQIKLPYTLYIHRVATRNLLIFFHNILVILPVILFYHQHLHFSVIHILLLLCGLIIFYFNAVCYGTIFAMMGSRYHDISQLIKSLIQIIFFMTPILWKPADLPANKQFLVGLNPIYSLLELIRAPLLGYSLSWLNIIMIFSFSAIGLMLAGFLFIPRRSRIIYWI